MTMTPYRPNPSIVPYKWRHRLAHWLGWGFGYVDTIDVNGIHWIGHRCSTCGVLSHMTPMQDSAGNWLRVRIYP